MDLSLELADEALLDHLYPPWMARDDIMRQSLSIGLISTIGGIFTYLAGAAFSYYFFFDHTLLTHPRFLQNQVALEIKAAFQSLPIVTVLIIPLFLAEVRGYAKLYANFDDYSIAYTVLSVIGWFVFSDMLSYWIHRVLHHRAVYAAIHKQHHKWTIPTPFASLALHPLDAFVQGLPYHLYVFFVPVHRVVFLVLFIFINFWGISVHDGFEVGKNSWFTGAAHHTVHHSEFVYNYGLFFTFWDRLGGSYMEPFESRQEPEREKQN